MVSQVLTVALSAFRHSNLFASKRPLRLIPWVRGWEAVEMGKNLKQDMNNEEDFSGLTGASSIPGRRTDARQKGQVKRSEHE